VLRDHPALMVLDVMLPKLDGFEVCRRLRASNDPTAIIMLTARDEDIDKILGLELGADDYLTKPFNPRELVARVKAILRRGERKESDAAQPVHIGDLTIDPARREVRLDSRTLDLRTQEFDLLLTLASHRGLVLSREQILQKAWGFDFYGQTRTVDVHVAHLRRKIESSNVKIETITGIGYKLVVA
jgi:DNA-binding response OmpR family regulator